MEDVAIQSLFDRLNNDPSLRRKLVEVIWPGEDLPGDDQPQHNNLAGNQRDGTSPHPENQLPVTERHHSGSLAANRRQFDPVTEGHQFDPGAERHHHSGDTILGDNEAQSGEGNSEEISHELSVPQIQGGELDNPAGGSTGFNNSNPNSLAIGDDHVFDAPQLTSNQRIC